jgi:hypothetical protein
MCLHLPSTTKPSSAAHRFGNVNCFRSFSEHEEHSGHVWTLTANYMPLETNNSHFYRHFRRERFLRLAWLPPVSTLHVATATYAECIAEGESREVCHSIRATLKVARELCSGSHLA